ncbi:MAG: DUF4157 domain-containing protein [Dehalococcoidia bacterium]|nr:DUF4157 domain-containing protein [Dehalococcoidia bacterium]
MKRTEGKTQTRQDNVEGERRHTREAAGPSLDPLHAAETDALELGETAFQPQADRHAALLSPLCSDAQRTGIMLRLQRTYGNAYVQRLLSSMAVQAKLTVNAPNDIYEQEADRVADAVTGAMSSQAQRQEEEEEPIQTQPVEEEEEQLQMKRASSVQRQEEEELAVAPASEVELRGEGQLMHEDDAAIQDGVIAQDIEAHIDRARRGRGGQPLPEGTRASLEPLFGHDFSHVRVHDGVEADGLSRQLKAKAFTTGKDVFFRANAYNANTEAGRSLLAHELTHVVQQGGKHIQRRVNTGRPQGPLGREIDRPAQRLMPTSQRQKEGAQQPQMLRRRVDVDVLVQTPNDAAIRAMTTVELNEQVDRLVSIGEMIDYQQRATLDRLQAELARREGELQAATSEELYQQCNRELSRLSFWLNSPGGLPLQTLRAYDGALANFVDATEATSAGGVQFADVFGIVLAMVPGVGPVAKWVGENAVRSAAVAVAQATAGAAASRITALSEEARSREERGARLSFAAGVRAASIPLADALARNADGVLTTYENAVDASRRTGDGALRSLLVTLQHENDELRSVDAGQYGELSRRFEIDLYRRHYSTRAHIHVISHNVWGVTSREVRGIPDDVQQALRVRLRAAQTMLELAEAWSLPERVTRTSGGPM